MQVLKAHRALLESLILVTIEGYVKDWDWDFKNSITSPYFGAVHWHRGRERDAGSFLDVAARKELFALYSGKVRDYPGDSPLLLAKGLVLWGCERLCPSSDETTSQVDSMEVWGQPSHIHLLLTSHYLSCDMHHSAQCW